VTPRQHRLASDALTGLGIAILALFAFACVGPCVDALHDGLLDDAGDRPDDPVVKFCARCGGDLPTPSPGDRCPSCVETLELEKSARRVRGDARCMLPLCSRTRSRSSALFCDVHERKR
jgi:hypothetical protein